MEKTVEGKIKRQLQNSVVLGRIYKRGNTLRTALYNQRCFFSGMEIYSSIMKKEKKKKKEICPLILPNNLNSEGLTIQA